MSLNPRVCKKSYKVHIPMMGEACEFWLITVTDEQSITNPDKDHAYLTDDGKLFVFNGDSLVRVNCDICFTQEEREKLEGIEEGANKYVLPVASSTELGGVLLGYTQNGRNYPITKDTKGNIYVNVPWEEYQLPKATDNALGGIKTGYKQNGKFYPIKTDTDGNAYVQVPWEDTNTVYEVVSKTSNGLMPMLPSDENASKRFLNGDGEWVVGTDNSINGVTQTGSTFSGETSDCGVQILEVQGKTVQQTTQGYQLFDASKLPTKTIGGATLTNNGDGSFTISGSGNLSANFNYYYYMGRNPLKVGRLTLKLNGPNSIIPLMQVIGLNKLGDGSNQYRVWNIVNEGSIDITKELLEQTKDIYIVFYSSQGKEIKPGTIKPMLYQDGDGTWEPFTGGKPAPNSDYPMPIENVEIKNIKSTNKNLFNLPTQTFSQNGITAIKNMDGSFTLNGTVTGNRFLMMLANHANKIKLEVGQQYTLSIGTILTPLNSNIVVGSYRSDESYITTLIGFGRGTSEKTETIQTEHDYIAAYFESPVGSVFDNLTIYPMLERGASKTEFVDSKSSVVETSLTLAKDDVYSKGTILRKRKKVVLDGSSDEDWKNFVANTRVQCQLDTVIRAKYTINVNGYCNRAVYRKTGNLNELKNNEFTIVSSEDFGGTRLIIRTPSDISTLEEWKTWLSTHNLVVEYELATPTTEEFKVPTIPSYEPYTEISTNSVVDPTITFRPLPFTTCLVGEATEEESGYMPPLSGNSNEFLNGSGEWSIPSGYTLPTASSSTLGGVKIGENITISSGTISIDKEDVTGALGYTPPTTNTTYSVATTSKDGLMSSTDKTKLNNLRRIWKGTSSSPPSGWVDGDIYVQYEE